MPPKTAKPALTLPSYVDMAGHLRNAISAHQAVHEGIATHAEKEKARREQANHDATPMPVLKQVDYGQ